MKTLRAFFCACVLLAAVPASAQTLVHRVDMARGSQPYNVTAVLLGSGLEFWAFGDSRAETLDLEIGKLFPFGKHLLFGGYAVEWPDSGKLFALPWTTYTDELGSARLNANLAAYLPLNGGPTILFSDETSLTWFNKRQSVGGGLVASFWMQEGGPPMLRLGPTLRLSRGKTSLKINCQPVYLSGKGEAAWRIEVARRF